MGNKEPIDLIALAVLVAEVGIYWSIDRFTTVSAPALFVLLLAPAAAIFAVGRGMASLSRARRDLKTWLPAILLLAASWVVSVLLVVVWPDRLPFQPWIVPAVWFLFAGIVLVLTVAIQRKTRSQDHRSARM